ncbi:MAG: hypothetical protein FD177_2538 [Desulfovibrionaceae bacterium]|nr:MAG: hypothetical protein FD177_2538 [Desulfovibrionaceae bacterium]
MSKILLFLQIFIAFTFIQSRHTAHACDENLELLPVSDEIKKLITDKNIKGIIDHLQPAHYIEDTIFTKTQLIKLLNNKQSWLHKQLFTSAHSIRNHMIKTPNLKACIYKHGEFYQISYLSPNPSIIRTPLTIITFTNGKWVFDDLFFNY